MARAASRAQRQNCGETPPAGLSSRSPPRSAVAGRSSARSLPPQAWAARVEAPDGTKGRRAARLAEQGVRAPEPGRAGPGDAPTRGRSDFPCAGPDTPLPSETRIPLPGKQQDPGGGPEQAVRTHQGLLLPVAAAAAALCGVQAGRARAPAPPLPGSLLVGRLRRRFLLLLLPAPGVAVSSAASCCCCFCCCCCFTPRLRRGARGAAEPLPPPPAHIQESFARACPQPGGGDRAQVCALARGLQCRFAVRGLTGTRARTLRLAQARRRLPRCLAPRRHSAPAPPTPPCPFLSFPGWCHFTQHIWE